MVLQPLYYFYYGLHCKSPMLKISHCCHSLVTVQSSVVRRLRKPGEGDMGDIGQPSKMFTLSMCTTVNRKTWGKPYTRVRWVSKFNLFEMVCGWIQRVCVSRYNIFLRSKWQCCSMSCAWRSKSKESRAYAVKYATRSNFCCVGPVRA